MTPAAIKTLAPIVIKELENLDMTFAVSIHRNGRRPVLGLQSGLRS